MLLEELEPKIGFSSVEKSEQPVYGWHQSLLSEHVLDHLPLKAKPKQIDVVCVVGQYDSISRPRTSLAARLCATLSSPFGFSS